MSNVWQPDMMPFFMRPKILTMSRQWIPLVGPLRTTRTSIAATPGVAAVNIHCGEHACVDSRVSNCYIFDCDSDLDCDGDIDFDVPYE